MQNPVDLPGKGFRRILGEQQDVFLRFEESPVLRMPGNVPGDHRSTGRHGFDDPSAIKFGEARQVHDSRPLSQVPHPLVEFGEADLLQGLGIFPDSLVGDCMAFCQVLGRDLLQLIEQLLIVRRRLSPFRVLQTPAQ